MKWTTDKPTEPGWYWYKPVSHHNHITMIKMRLAYNRELMIFHDTYPAKYHITFGDQFSGPIAEPEG